MGKDIYSSAEALYSTVLAPPDSASYEYRPNFWQRAGSLIEGTVDAVTTGIPTVAVSAANELLTLGNLFESAGSRRDWLRGVDDVLGSQLDKYYAANQTGVDLFSHIAAGIVPGMAAVKGVNALRGALATNSLRAGTATEGISWLAPNYFTQAASSRLKVAAAAEGAGLTAPAWKGFGSLPSFTLAGTTAIEFGVQGLAYEAGVSALALGGNPYYAGKSGSDIFKDAVTDGLLLGGGLGGVFGLFGGAKLARTIKEELALAQVEGAQQVAKAADLGGLAGTVGQGKTAKQFTYGDELADLVASSRAKFDSSVLTDTSTSGVLAAQRGFDSQLAGVNKRIDETILKITKDSDFEGIVLRDLVKRLPDEQVPYVLDKLVSVRRVTSAESAAREIDSAALFNVVTGDVLEQVPRGLHNYAKSLVAGVDDLVAETAGKEIVKFEKLGEVVNKLGAGQDFAAIKALDAERVQAALYWAESKGNYVQRPAKADAQGSVIAAAKSDVKENDLVSLLVAVNRAKETGTTLVTRLGGQVEELTLPQLGNLLEQAQLKSYSELVKLGDSSVDAMLKSGIKVTVDDAGNLVNGVRKFEAVPTPEIIAAEYRTAFSGRKGDLVARDEWISTHKLDAKLHVDYKLEQLSTEGKGIVGLQVGQDAERIIVPWTGATASEWAKASNIKAGGLVGSEVNYSKVSATAARLSRLSEKHADMLRERLVTGPTEAQKGLVSIDSQTEFLFVDRWAKSQRGQATLWEGAPQGASQVRPVYLVNQETAEKLAKVDSLDLEAALIQLSMADKNLNSQVLLVKSTDTAGYLKQYAQSTSYLKNSHEQLSQFFGNNATELSNLGKLEGGLQLYVPPVRVKDAPYSAYARRSPDSAYSQGEVIQITGADAADLARKINTLADRKEGWQVIDRTDSKQYFLLKGTYDKQLANNGWALNAREANMGVRVNTPGLGNIADVSQSWTQFLERSTQSLAQRQVEASNIKFFQELDAGARLADDLAKSFTGPEGARAAQGNLYADIRQVALNLPDTDNAIVKALKAVSYGANRAVDKVLSTVGSLKTDAYVDAQLASMEKLGLSTAAGKALTSAELRKELAEGLAGRQSSEYWVDRALRGLNVGLTRMALTYDPFHWVVNQISRPVLEVAEGRRIAAEFVRQGRGTPEELAQLTGVSSLLKSEHRAIEALFANENRKNLLASSEAYWKDFALPGETFGRMFERLGIVNKAGRVVHQDMVDQVSVGLRAAGDRGKVSSALDRLGNIKDDLLTKADFYGSQSEWYGQYAAAFRMAELGRLTKMPAEETLLLMNSYVQRMHGLHTVSQRALGFQGSVGSAVGLFQSYQFRLAQRVLDHVQAGDAKAIAIMAGLQSTMFGARTMPGFDAVNRHIVGKGNEDRRDIYDATYELVNKEVGDSLLYGVTGTLLGSGFFTRTDVNPRNVTLIPSSASEIPAVGFVSSLLGTVKTGFDAAGAGYGNAALAALEHNGLSRPAAGAAVLLRGASTDRAGNVVSRGASETLFSLSGAMRLAGARPMDEMILRDQVSKFAWYEQEYKEARKVISKQVRLAGQSAEAVPFSPEEMEVLAARWAKAGGNEEGFKRMFLKNLEQADQPLSERFAKKLQDRSAESKFRTLQSVMGGGD